MVYSWIDTSFFLKVSDLETDLQKLAVATTEGQGGDGPDVKQEIASNTEPVEMPEGDVIHSESNLYGFCFSEYYIFNNIEGTLLLF